MSGSQVTAHQSRLIALEEISDAMMVTLAERWPILTLEELRATRGRPDLVDALLRAKIDCARVVSGETLPRTRRHGRRGVHGLRRNWIASAFATASALVIAIAPRF